MSATAPCLRSDLSIIPQVYRGETNYVVKDLAAQKYFRFGPVEVRVMRCFDGRRTPSEIAASLASEGLRISVEAVETFARKMAASGFLERTVAERSTLQVERLRAERRKRQRPRLFRGELLRMRWSFGDPDRHLAKALPHVRWMFTRPFLTVSVVLFAVYCGLLGARWSEFKGAVAATYSLHTITFANVVALWLTAAFVILVHELGHAFTCKYFGGEVRELGFMLIYFQPAFYANVSDAWSFPDRRQRLWVTAAGSWIQLVVASLGAILWWAAAPGTIAASVALAAMLIGGLTTVFTNANPLLPLDGYFALTDWMDIPNLRQRAFAHFQWWVKRSVFRLDVPEPATTARERRIFLIYGALALAYAIGLFTFLASLALGWASRVMGGLGVALGLIAIFALLSKRITEWGRTVSLAVRARRQVLLTLRRRFAVGAAVLVLLLLVIPWTLTSPGTLVVRPVSTLVVSAADSGVIAQVFVTEGMRVAAGAPLVRVVDRALERELLATGRAVDSLTVSETAARSGGMSGAASRLAAERESALAALAALERRVGDLTLRAASAGTVATPRPEELIGRRVAPGDSLLALAALDSVELRIALAGAGATRVRVGQIVHAISFADLSQPFTARVADVSTIGITGAGAGGVIEARVRRPAGDAWRAGTIGEASVELERSNMLGALWWKARQLLRTDLWL